MYFTINAKLFDILLKEFIFIKTIDLKLENKTEVNTYSTRQNRLSYKSRYNKRFTWLTKPEYVTIILGLCAPDKYFRICTIKINGIIMRNRNKQNYNGRFYMTQ